MPPCDIWCPSRLIKINCSLIQASNWPPVVSQTVPPPSLASSQLQLAAGPVAPELSVAVAATGYRYGREFREKQHAAELFSRFCFVLTPHLSFLSLSSRRPGRSSPSASSSASHAGLLSRSSSSVLL